MTIEYRKGNLLDVTKGVIIHGCNMQGVMGAGVALAVKNKYPSAFIRYNLTVQECDLGDIIWYYVNDNLLIANALTQVNYGTLSKRHLNYAALVKAFDSAIYYCKNRNYELHFPKIGAGLAGGNWDIIEQLINDCDPDDEVTKICWEL